jgi:cell division protein FtsA
MKSKKNNIVIGLDIGTTKICAIVGEIKEDGLDIIGIGKSPSKGLRKGVVVNIESTVNSIRKAIEEAEIIAGCEIKQVYTGIAGGHIKGINSNGVVAIKHREVKEDDIRRAIDAAKALVIPMDREIIHVLPQEFIVDDQDGIKDPLGISGVRLEARVHIVTGAVTSAQNIIKCANKAGLKVMDFVLEQLASGEAVLNNDEKDLGVVLVDIGGGTTDIAIYSEGSVKYTSVLSLGGNHITNDIAIGLRTPMEEAEKIKKKCGCALTSMIPKDEAIEVPTVGKRRSRTISREILGEIIEPRVEEMLTLVKREIAKSGYEDLLPSGIVLTGGASIMEGMTEIAEDIFNLPVRRGVPVNIGGLTDIVNSPIYSTGVGLVLYGMRNKNKDTFDNGDDNLFIKIMKRMRRWFEEFF